MNVASNIGSAATVDPDQAFQTFEAEGEPYVRYRLQSQLYEREWSALAATWLVEKDTLRAKARRVRRRRARLGWIVMILACVAAGTYLDQAGVLGTAARAVVTR